MQEPGIGFRLLNPDQRFHNHSMQHEHTGFAAGQVFLGLDEVRHPKLLPLPSFNT